MSDDHSHSGSSSQAGPIANPYWLAAAPASQVGLLDRPADLAGLVADLAGGEMQDEDPGSGGTVVPGQGAGGDDRP